MNEPTKGLPDWLTTDLVIIVFTLTINLIWVWIEL
jgi:hypothetical protein